MPQLVIATVGGVTVVGSALPVRLSDLPGLGRAPPVVDRVAAVTCRQISVDTGMEPVCEPFVAVLPATSCSLVPGRPADVTSKSGGIALPCLVITRIGQGISVERKLVVFGGEGAQLLRSQLFSGCGLLALTEVGLGVIECALPLVEIPW